MADETQTAEPQEEAKEAAAGGGGMMGKLAVGGFIGVVILVEALMASLFIPSAEDIAAEAEKRRQAQANQMSDNDDENAQYTEVELGDFNITAKQAGKNMSLRVDFKLFGTVTNDNESEFRSLYERNQNRFRSRVLEVIRIAKVDDLQEAQLGLIKRRILEKSHDLFGKPLLRSVGFSEFHTMEQ